MSDQIGPENGVGVTVENNQGLESNEMNPLKKRRHECNNSPSEPLPPKLKGKRRSTNDLPPDTDGATAIIPESQVESELEKMFAGIVENEVEDQSNHKSNPAPAEKPKPNVKKKKRTLMKSKKQNTKKKFNKNTNKSNHEPDYIADSVVARGPKVPSIHLKDQRNNPLNISITNSFREEDEDKSKEKKKVNSSYYRSKGPQAADMFNSTLSLRYDARTADLTWVCVFCKKGPHFLTFGEKPKVIRFAVLSDLFGPYLIGSDSSVSAAQTEPEKRAKKSGKVSKRLNSVDKTVDYSVHGMRKLSDEDPKWEVWLHDKCAIWATNVYIMGSKIMGLEDAVWNAFNSTCKVCGLTGANISCMHRSCNSMTHFICGTTSGWLLDSGNFVTKCELHKYL